MGKTSRQKAKRKKSPRRSASGELRGAGKEILTFGMVSLGCPKNLVDSEKIAANLIEDGFVLMQDADSADVVIINTCSFIAPAREESLSVISEFAALRRRGKLRALVVAGCMAQQEREHLLDVHPEVDAAVSFSAYGRMAEVVRSCVDGGERFFVGGISDRLSAETGRLILSGRYCAYLRIAEGCSNNCTFCTIPSIRGRFHSKPPDAVLEEARELVEFGIKELVLIAQDTTSYGSDLGTGVDLPRLIASISAVEGVGWIRVMYANPARVTDELISAIADTSAVVKYLDLPIQHISGPVLKRMGRRPGERATRKLIHRLHERIPGLALRTSLMAGFPGETREDFGKLLRFVREGHFQRLGAFTYSPEAGTGAARMRNPVPPKLAARRRQQLMLTQQEVTFAFARSLIGKRVETLVESGGEEFPFEGRSYTDAPEIDCRAYIRSRDLRPGQIAVLRVVDTAGYDLILDK